MYFWLKWNRRAYQVTPGDAARCTGCVWQKRHPLVIWARLWVPTIHDRGARYKGLPKGGRQVLNTQKQTHEKRYRNESFLPLQTHRHPHCQGAFWKKNKWNQSPSILVCKKLFSIQTSKQHASTNIGMGMVLSFPLCSLDLSSHWTSITPNRSGLHVSEDIQERQQQRTWLGLFSRVCSSGFIQAPLVYSLLG